MADNPRIEDLRRRVQKDPASIAFAQLAEEYRRAGQLQESVDACRAGLAIHPGYLSAHVTLGRALIELDQLDDAKSELELVLKSAPENLAAIRGLAEIYHRRGALDDALTQYRAALNLARNDPDLEETVNELTRELAPAKGRQSADGLSFAQMQQELPRPQTSQPRRRKQLPMWGRTRFEDLRISGSEDLKSSPPNPQLKSLKSPKSSHPQILKSSHPSNSQSKSYLKITKTRAPCGPSRRSSSGSPPSMSHAPTDTLSRRHAAIRQVLAARGLDALAVTSLPNIRYLTNFGGSSAAVVVTADRLRFITDFRYLTALDSTRGTGWECPDLEVVRVDSSYDQTLATVPGGDAWGARRFRVGASHRRPSPLDRVAPRRRGAGCRIARGRGGDRRGRCASARMRTRSRRFAKPPGSCRRSRAASSKRSGPDEPSATSL